MTISEMDEAIREYCDEQRDCVNCPLYMYSNENCYGYIDKDIIVTAHQRMEEAYKMDIKMESVDSRELGFQPRTLKEILEKRNF